MENIKKNVDLGQPASFLDHVYLGCTQRECQISKDFVGNYRSMFESRISARASEKLPDTKATRKPDAETISSWSYEKESHAKKRVERYCELPNIWRLNNSTKYQFHASMTNTLKRMFAICKVTVTSLLPKWSEMLTHGTYWKTWNFMVSEHFCLCGNEIKKLCQTCRTFHRTHSSRKLLHVENHNTTMRIRINSGLWFCRRLWRFRVYIRRNSVHFRKPTIHANELDVQETDFCFTLFYKSWSQIFQYRFTHGWDSRSRSLKIWWLKYFIPHQTKPTKPKKKEIHGEPFRQLLILTCENQFQPRTPIRLWPTLITFHHKNTFSIQCHVECFCGQWSRDWNGNQRPIKRHMSKPTEFLWIGCLKF